ncbi:MAG: threonine/serine exporter family protein [Lachnospiraceae bacterium]|nr:threonine/serine exporter family protein [Lachnospiraceae bacterium]
MAYTKEVLNLAVEVGEAMLRSGAEIYRVEDTVKHILNAYEVDDCNIYVLSNGIFASANEGKEDVCSIIRHVPLSAVHLSRIAALNQLSREICSHECSLMDAWIRLDECKALKNYSMKKQLFFCGLGCAGFAWLCGGQIIDAVITFFIGVLLRAMILMAEKYKISALMVNLSGSFLTTAVSLLMANLGLPVLQDKIVIGGIMALVPGITFTTSVRDFMNGDYLSGVIHMSDALLTSFEIAVGVGAMFAFYQMITGGAFGV